MTKSTKTRIVKASEQASATEAIVPQPIPVITHPSLSGSSTSWTSTAGGSFNTAANWSNGVPVAGVDATIGEASTDPITVTISGVSDTADSLTTQYAPLSITNGTLILQGVQQGSNLATGSGTALTEAGGLIDFQNGPSQNDTSTISGSGAAVQQSAGTIEVDAGTLNISGNSFFGGTLTGIGGKPDSGTITLGSGATYTFASTAVVEIGELVLTGGASMIQAGNILYQGNFIQSNGTTLNLGGHGLTLVDTAGTISSEDGFISGGTLLNRTSLSVFNATLASGATFNNDGTLLLNQGPQNLGGGTAITLGNGGTAAALLENTTGGTISVLNGGYSISGGTFTNAALISLATNGNLSTTATFSNTGTVSVAAADTFSTQGGLTNSDTIAGAGTFLINGPGTYTIASGSAVSVANLVDSGGGTTTLNINGGSISSGTLAFEGGLVNLNENLSYGGIFTASADLSVLTINLGANTLSLTGRNSFAPYNFGAVLASGKGTLALSGTTTISGSLELGENTTLSNSGALIQNAPVYIGDTIAPGAVINGASGVWNILGGNTLGAVSGSTGSPNSTFANAGTLEDTASGTTATIDAVSTSSGIINAANGAAIDFINTLSNTGTIGGAGEFSVTAGTTTLGTNSVVTSGTFNIANSGDLALGTSLSYGGIFDDTSSAAAGMNLGGNTLTLNGSLVTLGAGGTTTSIDGPGTLDLASANTTFAGGGTTILGDAASVINTGIVTQDGIVQLGDNAGTSAGISNSATGTWTLATGAGLNRGTDYNTVFANAGTFQGTSLGSAAAIYAVFQNTGVVSAQNSEIDFYSSFTNAGTLAGTGAIGIRGSSIATLSAGSVLNVAQFNLYDQSTLDLAANIAYAGVFNDQGSNTTTVNLAGKTLSLSGAADFGAAYNDAIVDGPGTLAVSGATTITTSAYGLLLGSTAAMTNTGSVLQAGVLQIGDASGAIATVTNSAAGTWALSTGNGINTGSNASSSFTNAGLFENTGSSAIQAIHAIFNNTGTINIAAGDETDFYNVLSNSKTISGTGTLGIRGSGMATFSAGEVVSIAQINLYDSANLDLATNLAYAGLFNDQGSNTSTVNLAGHTLSLSGRANLGATYNPALIEGPGTFSVSGTATITGNTYGIELGGTAAMTNTGTVIQDGQVQIGDSSGSVATITNSATGTWMAANSNSLGTGSNAASIFTNAGLFENTGSSDSQSLTADFSNTGRLAIAATDQTTIYGTLTNTGTISGSGTFGISNSGTAIFSAGSVITVSQINLFNSATLNIGTNLTYAGVFNDQGSNTTTLNLASNTLSLTGSAIFGATYNPAYVAGSGTLSLSCTTTITGAGYGLELGGSDALVNTATVIESGNVQIGDGSGNVATITNSATGTWNFATSTGLSTGNNASSSFTNAGLVRNIGTGNTIRIGAVFNNTGTLTDTNAGSFIQLADGGSIAGTLSGAGEIDFTGGISTLGSATTLSIAAIGIFNGGTNLSLSAAASYAGSLTLGAGATLTLSSATTKLTLTGQESLDGLVTGAGTVALSTGGTLIADNLTLGNAVTLLDAGGTIAQGANITIGNSSASTADLSIAAGSTYELTNAVTIGSDGLGAITNAGTFAMLAGTGTSTIDPLFTNTGTVSAGSGALTFAANFTNNGIAAAANGNEVVFNGSINATSTSTGTIKLSGGGLAAFGGFVGSSQTLAFLDGSSSKAFLENPSNFDGTISGFSGTNELVLSDFENVTSSTYSNGVLALTGSNDGGTLTVVDLHFAGSYTLGNFTIENNGAGGLLILDPPAHH